jgi:glyoxalase family protein
VQATRTPEDSLRFADPEGLDHELVVSRVPDAPLVAEHPEIPPAVALQGFEGVRAYSHAPEQSAELLEQLMQARPRDGAAGSCAASTAAAGSPSIPHRPSAGGQSAGIVHHIAWGTTDAELPGWIDAVAQAGIPSSGYVDRHFFHSLYFREPGGVLYELATEEPGFTVVAPVEEFGRDIILPRSSSTTASASRPA